MYTFSSKISPDEVIGSSLVQRSWESVILGDPARAARREIGPYFFENAIGFNPNYQRQSTERDTDSSTLVGGSRGPNKTNRNIVRQITKFGIIVFCEIFINI